jgi:two-component system phosphate regulon sensor histidine kinase PhoR
LAVSLAGVDLYVTRLSYADQTRSLRESLTAQARLLATELAGSRAPLQEWASSAALRTGARITLLDSGNSMLAEAGPDPSSGEFEYVTAPLPSSAPAAAIRMGQSLAPIQANVRELGIWLFILFVVSLTLAAVLGFVFVRSFSWQISSLQAYTEHLLDPKAPEQVLPSGDDDLGALGQSLRRTVPRIRELVESLQLEGARREAILTSMVEGVLAVDKDLRVTFCNNSFARTVAARVPVSPGIQLLELVRDPELTEIMNAVLATGEPVERQVNLRAAEGHSFEVLASPLAGPSTRGALAILHDVTELERLERVRKDFVANVSHELRTPLAAIRGYAETLLDGALDDQKHNRRFVEIIHAQATRLSNIASDLLTISELESSETAPPPKPVSVKAALESALRTVESAARLRDVRIVCGELDDPVVLGNELKLEQVFVNLLDNAVKFNRPGGEVRVEIRSSQHTGQIVISDTGIGIPSGDLPRIFERFYRVDKARSREMGGTGLGLSIVKHVVEQMGGTVVVESRVGEGSRFTLTVPVFLGSLAS